MIGGPATKFRLVRCPKCWKLLPEMAEYPLYQCGGCGVLLRAKNKGNSTRSGPDFRRSEQVHASEDNASSSPSEGAIPSSTEECSLNNKIGRGDLGDSGTEQPEVKFSDGVSTAAKQPEDVNLSNIVPSSMERPEDVNLSNEVSSPTKHCDDVNISDEHPSYRVPEECSLNDKTGRGDPGDSCTEQPEVKFYNGVSTETKLPEDVNLSNRVPSSMGQPEDVNLSNEVSSPTKHCDDVNISDEHPSYSVQPQDMNSSNEISSLVEHPEDVNISNEGSSSDAQHDNMNSSNEISSLVEHLEDVNISNEGSSSDVQHEDMNSSNEISSLVEHLEDVNISNEGTSSDVQHDDMNSNEVSSPMEHPGDVNISNEGSSSDVQHHDDVNSSNEVSSPMEHPEDVNISNEGSSPNMQPEDGKFSNEVSSSEEQPEDVSFSNRVSPLMEQPEDEFSDGVSSPTEQPEDVNVLTEVPSSLEQPEDVDCLDEISSPKEQSEHVDFSDEVASPKEQPEVKNFSNEVSSSRRQHPDNLNFLKEVSLSMEEPEGVSYSNEVSLSTEKPEDLSYLNEVSLSAELLCHENDKPQPVVGTNSVYEDDEGGCYFRSLSSDSLLASRERNSEVTVQRLTGESTKKSTPLSHSNEQLEQSEDDILHGFEQVRSLDILGRTEVVEPSSELRETLGYMYRSPTARSYYGYDGSVSSYDGTDDQVLDRPLHQPNGTFKARKFLGPEERSTRKFLVNGNLETQSQARNSSPILSGEEHYLKNYSKWNRDGCLGPRKYDQPLRDWRMERGEFLSRFPVYGRDSPAGYENDNPSSTGHPDYWCSSSFHSPKKSELNEQERIKLLKMVRELQDEINRKNNIESPTRVGWKGKHIARSYYHEASEEEIFNDVNYPWFPEQCRTGRNWPQRHKFSRMAFSGEAPNSRYQADCSCSHCCPQDRWYSAQLPPTVPSCKNGLHGAHPAHRCYHYTSSHSSPLRFMDYEIPAWTHGPKSEDQGHKNHEATLYRKEKQKQVKRHIQPIAGGAPFLICYRCSNLLQLPADFLLFKRRCHGLRCGACYELLKFSVENRTHIVRYTPNAAVPPPPSEVDDMSRNLNGVALASTDLVNDCCLPADPVSCSDDYGLSFCKSISTEGGEPAFITPPFEKMGARNKRTNFKRSLNKYKKPVESHESIGSSSNMAKPEQSCTEIEELPPTTASPLFRLMDYSSPNALIYGGGMDSD